jgi:hypothetical protein
MRGLLCEEQKQNPLLYISKQKQESIFLEAVRYAKDSHEQSKLNKRLVVQGTKQSPSLCTLKPEQQSISLEAVRISCPWGGKAFSGLFVPFKAGSEMLPASSGAANSLRVLRFS